MQELRNQILCGDCVEILRAVREPFADLVFADPPFNIGYKYDKYHDEKASEQYLAWTRDWIGACVRVLQPHGSIYIAIGDEYAAHIKLILEDELGLTLRNWIIWHYTFGQQTRNKFARSHTHILYFVKDPKNFVFHDEVVRVISDRQKKYSDKRANPAGKMPDDVWNEYPRVCGTFTERTGFPCQMPESLLARIIRVSSKEGDWVLDPFCGSGTTATVAHKLNRTYTSIDLSETYVQAAKERIAESEGLPEIWKTESAAAAKLVSSDGCGERGRNRRRTDATDASGATAAGRPSSNWPEHADAELKWLYSENKIPIRHLCANRSLLSLFTKKLNGRLQKNQPYTITEVQDRLNLLGSRLSPLDKTSPARMEASSLEE
jgi:DNA modification methylase